MSRKLVIPAIAVVLGIICLFVTLTIYRKIIPGKNPLNIENSPGHIDKDWDKPGILAESTHFIGRSKGEKRWEFRAERTLSADDSDWIRLENIQDGIFYNENEAWAYFSADQAVVNIKTGNLDLDNVIFRSSSGDSLIARTLTWDKDYGKAVLEGNVCMRQSENSILTCDRAEYTPGDNILEFVGEIVFKII